MTKIPIILSYGFGVESTAILLRWLFEPQTRYFVTRTAQPQREYFDLADLTIIGSQTGDEHQDTQNNVERYIFPLLRQHRIRFVEVARAGEHESDGIIVFQDSTEPRIFHRAGAYKLSDHLKLAGTVPQYGGEHRCAMHYKSFVIEHWLKYYFGRNDVCHVFGYNRDETQRAARSATGIAARNEQVLVAFGYNKDEGARADRNQAAYQATNAREQTQTRTVRVAFGYNAAEAGRADNSDAAYAKRNGRSQEVRVAFGFNVDEGNRAARATELDRQERRVAFGYNAAELNRAARTATHDTIARIGFYPLIDWGWSRTACENYIIEKLGIPFQKSACVFCPFNREASKSTPKGIARLQAHPEQTADALLVEYTSLCLNPRGALFNTKTLHTIVVNSEQNAARAAFEHKLGQMEYGLYEVKRLYSGPGTAARSVIQIAKGQRAEMIAQFESFVSSLKLKPQSERGITYGYFAERGPDYPAIEGFLVVAPATVGTKVRGQFPVFEERFLQAARQLRIKFPLTPGTALVQSPLFFSSLAAEGGRTRDSFEVLR
jgi:hypothetical protein